MFEHAMTFNFSQEVKEDFLEDTSGNPTPRNSEQLTQPVFFA
jgi:hypothetical protein